MFLSGLCHDFLKGTDDLAIQLLTHISETQKGQTLVQFLTKLTTAAYLTFEHED